VKFKSGTPNTRVVGKIATLDKQGVDGTGRNTTVPPCSVTVELLIRLEAA